MSSSASLEVGNPTVRPALFTALSPVIALLALGTALLRGYLGRGVLGLEYAGPGVLGTPPPPIGLQWVYLAEAAGFVVLLVLLYAPLPFLPRDRSGIRFLMLVYALATSVIYLVIESGGRFSFIGLASVAVDLLLMVAVVRESRKVGPLQPGPFAVEHDRAR